MTSRSDFERLREVFTDAAYDIVPSPVPLAAIEKASRVRRRRRAAGLAVGCALLLAPSAAVALHLIGPAPATVVRPAATATPAPPPAPPSPTATARAVRVVAPGERVRVLPGAELWLTEEGKHWSTPEMAEQFRSVTDGNLDTSSPDVAFQSEAVGDRYFLSGLYYGTDKAAAVKVVTQHGTLTATMVRLAGHPDWGVWYATSALPDAPEFPDAFFRSITVYDAAGRTLATLALG
ncbi:hypothetical protein [Streptomyces sp. AK02-01A]|uniref:hypothetical protein n=1 Tax=Streptomyces sp. AK02-01A TaxID=3028648 RepID=UPI0029A9265B|nr:hypothetical protein [Streptomyces sp. AK02-01A]MDX3853239.1 hypothetical protein [Streptomyces sp. AK02-01A]